MKVAMNKLSVPISLKPKDFHYCGHKGPYLESYFDQSFDSKVDVGGWIYVPIYWTNLGRHQFDHALEWLCPQLDRGKRYFTIVLDAVGLPHSINNLRVYGPSSGEAAVPLIACEPQAKELDKQYDLGFLGSINSSTDYLGLRTVLHQWASKQPGNHMLIPNAPLPFQEYIRAVEQTRITLAPRGFGPTSFRLYEALAVGSVPVYLWDQDCRLPYHLEEEWQEFSFIIQRNEIDGLSERIQNSDLEHMRLTGMDFFQRRCTLSATCDWIVKDLRSTTNE